MFLHSRLDRSAGMVTRHSPIQPRHRLSRRRCFCLRTRRSYYNSVSSVALLSHQEIFRTKDSWPPLTWPTGDPGPLRRNPLTTELLKPHSIHSYQTCKKKRFHEMKHLEIVVKYYIFGKEFNFYLENNNINFRPKSNIL